MNSLLVVGGQTLHKSNEIYVPLEYTQGRPWFDRKGLENSGLDKSRVSDFSDFWESCYRNPK